MVRRLIFFLLFSLSGFTALIWQIFWQLDLSVALEDSAQTKFLSVSIALATIALGALWSGKKLETSPPKNPWMFFGLLQIAVGLLGWLPLIFQPVIEAADVAVFRSAPFLSAPFSALILILVIGPGSFCIGATLPVIGVLAKESGVLMSRLVAAILAGSAFGAHGLTFFLMPAFGRLGAGISVTFFHIAIFGIAWRISKQGEVDFSKKEKKSSESKSRKTARRTATPLAPRAALILIVAAGLGTFMLGESWFQLLRSAWLDTTDSFAVMVFIFLIALSFGAHLSRRLRGFGVALPVMISLGAMAIWIGTPLVERFDLWGSAGGNYYVRILTKILISLAVMGLPAAMIGMALPWLLDDVKSPREWGKLIAVYFISAVVGSLMGGWILMELLGPVITAWLAGVVLATAAISQVQNGKGRLELAIPSLMLVAVAWWASSGIGTTRSQGPTKMLRAPHELLAHIDGPDATTSVVKTQEGELGFFVDGYATTFESSSTGADFLDAMGALPMLMHSNPQDALVLRFGTGRTARAVLNENPARLTVIDSNPAAFELAEFFKKSNRGLLESDQVRYLTTDARTWLRRTEDQYDVVTLEPLPPFFTGMNAQYSVEFYELLSEKTREDGFIAQWFPLFLLTPDHAEAVAAAFAEVFPNSILWLDTRSADANGLLRQGILIGRKGDSPWDRWPGFQREPLEPRTLDYDFVNSSVVLDVDAMASYVEEVTPVTDDNQLLTFGSESLHRQDLSRRLVTAENRDALLEAIERIRGSQAE